VRFPWLAAVAQSGAGLILAIGLLVAAAPLTLPDRAPETSVAPPAARAMWVWQTADPTALVAWATAHEVRTMFVYVDRKAIDATETARLTDLRKRCDAAGVLLDALGGEPDWATDHAPALAWKDAVDALGLFHGVHLDVEPYLLPAWNTDRDPVVRGYLSLLDAFGTGLPLEVDVPFWYGTVPVGDATLADEVIGRVDGLTVMSYRDTATGTNSMLDVSRDLLTRAGQAGLPVRLAAETEPLADCRTCSFAGVTQATLGDRLTAAGQAAQRYPAFAGIAVHQFSSWSALPA
jgi:hypothetical protein